MKHVIIGLYLLISPLLILDAYIRDDIHSAIYYYVSESKILMGPFYDEVKQPTAKISSSMYMGGDKNRSSEHPVSDSESDSDTSSNAELRENFYRYDNRLHALAEHRLNQSGLGDAPATKENNKIIHEY